MHFPLDHNGVLYLRTSPPVPWVPPKLLYLNRRLNEGGENTDGHGREEEIWHHTRLHFQSLPERRLSRDGKDVLQGQGVVSISVIL